MNRKLFLLLALAACFALPLGHLAAQGASPAAADASLLPYGEPNDTFATATPIVRGIVSYFDSGPLGYFTSQSDVDFYRWTTDRPENLVARVELYSANHPTPLRVEVALYDAAQNLLVEDTTCADPARVERLVPPGDYYIRVRPCPGALDIDRAYPLMVSGRGMEWEPNNTRATASPLKLSGDVDYGVDVYSAISPAGDVDFYRFQAETGRILRVDMTYSDVFTPQVSLLDAAGAVLSNGQANCHPHCLTYTISAGGVYYLRVRSAAHPIGEGAYELRYGFSDYYFEVEPNDTPGQAPLVGIDYHVIGDVGGSDAADYYRFYGQAGDRIAFIEGRSYEQHATAITLYDPAMQPVAVNGLARVAVLPATGQYTFSVALAAGTDPVHYGVLVTFLPVDEPNDTWQTATPATIGQTITSAYDYPCDDDWYRFQGRKGDVLNFIDPLDPPHPFATSPFAWLYDANGNRLPADVVLPADGTYYLRVLGLLTADFLEYESECNIGVYSFTVGQSLWISAPVDGLGGDATIKRGDIVTRKTAAGQWQLVFDASDVGITADVTAIERLPNGTVLMALGAAQNVPGLGKVMPQDVIRFIPTTLGANTSGTFRWFLDGSDVGLSATGEKIDAISYYGDAANPLRISLAGSGSVPKDGGGTLVVADEDVITFVQTQRGANTAGAWQMNLDGSTVPGLAAEDVNALSRIQIDRTGPWPELMVLFDSFTINGVSGGPKDVFDLNNGLWVKNLADKKIDALTVGAALP